MRTEFNKTTFFISKSSNEMKWNNFEPNQQIVKTKKTLIHLYNIRKIKTFYATIQAAKRLTIIPLLFNLKT